MALKSIYISFLIFTPVYQFYSATEHMLCHIWCYIEQWSAPTLYDRHEENKRLTQIKWSHYGFKTNNGSKFPFIRQKLVMNNNKLSHSIIAQLPDILIIFLIFMARAVVANLPLVHDGKTGYIWEPITHLYIIIIRTLLASIHASAQDPWLVSCNA